MTWDDPPTTYRVASQKFLMNTFEPHISHRYASDDISPAIVGSFQSLIVGKPTKFPKIGYLVQQSTNPMNT